MSKHDQRTRQYFLKENFLIGKTENHNFYSGMKNDLFGIIDYLAINQARTIGVQSCSTDINPHILKFYLEKRAEVKTWLASRELVLIGWRKLKLKRGGKAYRWKPRIIIFFLENNKIKMVEKDDFF